jgi:dTDP-4-dehydrorhamnose reductase
MLGTDLAGEFARRGIAHTVWDLPELDITDAAAAGRVVAAGDIIVNCAAYTNVDGAESQRELAQAVNADAVGRLGDIAAQAGKYVLQISTDFVFDGNLDRPYRETDAANPASVYGRTKLAGEELLRQSGCRSCIMRVQWTEPHRVARSRWSMTSTARRPPRPRSPGRYACCLKRKQRVHTTSLRRVLQAGLRPPGSSLTGGS